MQHANIRTVVVTALFAAIIYIGIQAFRIPLPAATGTPFVHFGHIFIVLAVIFLGPKRSAVAGILGLIVFDLLNGYVQSIPNVFVTTLINCLLSGYIYLALKKRADGNSRREYLSALLCAVIYGLCNIITDFLWSTGELILVGSSVQSALATEITAIPATIINAVFTVIGIAVLYLPVKRGYRLLE